MRLLGMILFWTALSIALGYEVRGDEVIRGAPCIRRLYQIFCRNAGSQYPIDRIETFISENRALTRRMFGEFPRPSDVAQEVHFPDIENFQTVDFPESVRERYSVVEWAASEAKKSASESESEASESTTVASEPGIATESSVPPIDPGVNGAETPQGGVQSNGEEGTADGTLETTVETPLEAAELDQQSDASVMSEQSTKGRMEAPSENGKSNRTQLYTTSVIRPRPLGFFRIDSRPRTDQDAAEESRSSWSEIDRALRSRGTVRGARRPFLTRINPTTTSVANQESTLSAATNQQPTPAMMGYGTTLPLISDSVAPASLRGGSSAGNSTIGVPPPHPLEEQAKQRRKRQTVKAPPAIDKGSKHLEDSCESKVELITPYWAANSAGEIRAIVNTKHFPQAIHQEICKGTSTNRCTGDCICEQKYTYHRLLAYDPDNDCKGIFIDWFLFPSCCACRCPP